MTGAELANGALHSASSIRRFISTAYSIGSSLTIGSMKPLTISFEASSSSMRATAGRRAASSPTFDTVASWPTSTSSSPMRIVG